MTIIEHSNSLTVGISISESPDLASFGLGEGHFRDAMVNIAMYLLAAGDDLAYGGDLRPDGFTETLFELVHRYTRQSIGSNQAPNSPDIINEPVRVANYLAWPVHANMTSAYIDDLVAGIGNFATIVFLDINGHTIPLDTRKLHQQTKPRDTDWTPGLTHMRMAMRSRIDARVLLGGRTKGYKGRMPGIAEEALLSLEARQPIFLLGGFGGATRDVAEALNLASPWEGSREQWEGQSDFTEFGPESLNNTLSHEENLALATTPYIDRSLPLLLRGLRRLRNGVNNNIKSE